MEVIGMRRKAKEEKKRHWSSSSREWK